MAGVDHAHIHGWRQVLALFTTGKGVTVRKVRSAKSATPGLSWFAAKPAEDGPKVVEPLLGQLETYHDGPGDRHL